jgi:NADH-quinone oxidoreductase subunit C
MPLLPDEILRRLTDRFGDKVLPCKSPGSGQAFALVGREHVRPILAHLRDDRELAFDFLVDVTVVDHLQLELPELEGHRFAVVYILRSLSRSHVFEVKARVPEDDPVIPSVHDLWKSALWGEREAHDMYGVEFEGNPDMRRLLMPEDYPGFPLRKDYPLRGRGERDAFPQYRPPSIPAEPGRAGEAPR